MQKDETKPEINRLINKAINAPYIDDNIIYKSLYFYD